MSNDHKPYCALCQRSDETNITGTLSTKKNVTAHQNCLLFSSGIYCKESPEFDDLFGFTVKDVLVEVKRGTKLSCKYCGKKGATAGCENRRCKKSFHYPCAVEGKAKIFENNSDGKYGLYCSLNCESKKSSSKKLCEAGPSMCSKESVPRTEASSSSGTPRHPPIQKRKMNGVFSGGGPSSHGSDSSGTTRSSSKRRLSFSDEEEEGNPSKQKRNGGKRIVSDDSSESDVNELIAPLESDLEESGNFPQENQPSEPQLISRSLSVSFCPHSRDSGRPSAFQEVEGEVRNENIDDDETLISDAESESLLPPPKERVEPQSRAGSPAQIASPGHPRVSLCEAAVQTVVKIECEDPGLQQCPPTSPERPSGGPPATQPSSAAPCSVTTSPPCSSLVLPIAPGEVFYMTPSPPPTPDLPAPTSDPEPRIDSSLFWRNCNAAGCTQAIFADFTNGMNDIFSRVQAEEASQEDYDRALSVIQASGRLAEFVARQREEIQRKQREVQRAVAAMEEVLSALRE